MGKWNLKNPAELSMGLDSSSSINLAYLKLPRWRSRCRFSTPFSFDWRICHGKSSTEQVGISASMAFVPARKLSNKNSEEILANNTHATNRERYARLHQPEVCSPRSLAISTHKLRCTCSKWLLFSIECLPLILTSCTKKKVIHRACPKG